MNSDFLVLSRRIRHEYQRIIDCLDAHSWNTQRVNRMTVPCVSILTAA